MESTPKQSSHNEDLLSIVSRSTRSPAKKRIKMQLFQDQEEILVTDGKSTRKSKLRLVAHKNFISRSSARKAKQNVFPDPVGAQTNTSSCFKTLFRAARWKSRTLLEIWSPQLRWADPPFCKERARRQRQNTYNECWLNPFYFYAKPPDAPQSAPVFFYFSVSFLPNQPIKC